jgi:Rrf2 family iron-sulfur cluster assembly transcriptional regulator
MVELATEAGETEMPIVRMAQNYGLSQSSMEQLFARLRRAGLVAGRRGRRGGYRLSREIDEITVAQIVGAVDDEYQGGKSGRGRSRKASVSPWECISFRLYDYLNGITLADLIGTTENADHRGNIELCGEGGARKTTTSTAKRRGRAASSRR